MSFYLAGAAWRAKVAPTTKLVLLCLADTANDDGECWPSIQTICKKTGLSRRAVINHIETLCKEGFLTKTRRTKDNGEQTSNLLKIVCMNPVGSEQDAPGGGAPRAPGSAPNAPGGVHHVHPGSAPRAPEPIKEPISLEPIKETGVEKATNKKDALEGKLRDLCLSRREKVLTLMPKVLSIYEIEAEKFVAHFSVKPLKADYSVSLLNWMQRANASAVPQQPRPAQKPHVTPEEADAIERTIRRYHEQPLHN